MSLTFHKSFYLIPFSLILFFLWTFQMNLSFLIILFSLPLTLTSSSPFPSFSFCYFESLHWMNYVFFFSFYLSFLSLELFSKLFSTSFLPFFSFSILFLISHHSQLFPLNNSTKQVFFFNLNILGHQLLFLLVSSN